MSQEMTIVGALQRAARRHPHKRVVVVPPQARTYAELADRAERLAAGLRRAGVGRGENVAVLMGNRIEFAEIYFGVLRAGATLVVLNARWKAPELSPLLRRCAVRWLVFAHEQAAEVEALDAPLPQALTRVVVGTGSAPGAIAYESLLVAPAPAAGGGAKRQTPEAGANAEAGAMTEVAGVTESAGMAEPAEADDACMLFTSGTTGEPKGVVLTHRNVFFQAIHHLVEWDVRTDDVELYPGPVFHGGGLAALPRTVLAGSTLVLMPSFDAHAFMAALVRERATRAVLVPTMCAHLVELAGAGGMPEHALRLIVTGGGAMPFELKRRLIELLPGVGVCDSYGQTEATGSVACLKPGEALRKPGSIGRAFFLNELRLVDDADADVPAGEVGEIVVRGPTVMRGYHGDAAASAAALRGGWLHTGDLARQDDEDFLYLVGRKKDMIVSGGVNIYPREIEEVLSAHPAVLEAAVIGVPDALWGESVKALVVLRPGPAPSADELIAFCRARLAGYKKPRSLEIVPALPKNALGKVIKAELRQSFGSLPVRDA